VVRLLAAFHLFNLEKWEKCGCPECLERDGLRVAWVEDTANRKTLRLLVPLQPTLPGVMVLPPCSESLNTKSE
jgi:hypothetical protein